MESIFRVGGALLIGAALIGGAFYIEHRGIADGQAATSPALVVANDTVRSVQTSTDTDGDGIPDWEEELQGTDPLVHTTFATTTTEDGEEYTPPTTVTGKFSERFFEDLMRTGAGREMSDEERAALVQRSVQTLASEIKDTLYTRAQINITTADDMTAFREYGNTISSIIERYESPEKNEMTILGNALQNNDPALLAPLTLVESGYAQIIENMLRVPVPPSLAKQHLDLVNTLSMVHADVKAMQQVFDDPMPALVRVQRYEDDAAGLFYAIENIRIALEKKGVVYASTEPGIFLFSIRP